MSTKTTVETKEDNIYLNMTLTNNNEVSIPAAVAQTFTADIVSDSSQYFLSIIRFELLGVKIPLFIFQSNYYYVSLTYLGVTYSAPVLYPAQKNVIPVYGDAIYSYVQFLNYINAAFATAFGLIPSPPVGSTAPYMLLNQSSGIISLYADGRFYDDTLGTPINVYMNQNLYKFFENFNVQFYSENAVDYLDYRIIILNYYDSNTSVLDPTIPPNFYKISQDYANPSRFAQPDRIVFTSGQIGVRPEYSQNANSTTNLIDNSNAGGGPPVSNILTDFIPAFSSTDFAGWRTDLSYLPSSQYRLVDLLGLRVNQIDVQVFWADQRNNLFPIYIEAGRSLQIKFGFFKKSLYKNYESAQVSAAHHTLTTKK